MLILLHILGSAMCDKAHCCPLLPLLPIVVMSPLYHPPMSPLYHPPYYPQCHPHITLISPPMSWDGTGRDGMYATIVIMVDPSARYIMIIISMTSLTHVQTGLTKTDCLAGLPQPVGTPQTPGQGLHEYFDFLLISPATTFKTLDKRFLRLRNYLDLPLCRLSCPESLPCSRGRWRWQSPRRSWWSSWRWTWSELRTGWKASEKFAHHHISVAVVVELVVACICQMNPKAGSSAVEDLDGSIDPHLGDRELVQSKRLQGVSCKPGCHSTAPSLHGDSTWVLIGRDFCVPSRDITKFALSFSDHQLSFYWSCCSDLEKLLWPFGAGMSEDLNGLSENLNMGLLLLGNTSTPSLHTRTPFGARMWLTQSHQLHRQASGPCWEK